MNGTEITSEERRGAELDYLKYHGREYLNSLLETTGRPQPEFLAVHPRYLRLVESELIDIFWSSVAYIWRGKNMPTGS